eukprot:Gb_25513 [translate_table: standard]
MGHRRRVIRLFLAGHGWAECDGVISASASKSAGGIVVCVAISLRAGRLKNLRVSRRLTRVWVAKFTTAAVLRVPKCLACAPARQHSRILATVILHLQLFGAAAVEVCDAAGGVARS